ncbi:GNAT family N-acetyltransferase [Tenacibaculum sp. M341]|uniref:GNAT family N-acetyltransferase n=1 Tax=Tenacibaculum sp. M341 TaxID=2530339 RepID=UPI00104E642B|nr:GNAT family protein [Tenacibaculum sp. M341]TCI95109.1 N-acetyltransferase [Tenacibaculum sp. M341]
MNTLKGKLVSLKAIEPEDLEFLFTIENDESFWELSNTQAPFSKFLLKQYIENCHLDIYEAKQLRLAVKENGTNKNVGLIDLFDFDPKNKRAGVGIIIHTNSQKKGYASEALSLLINYSFIHLQLHQLYANVTSDNNNSLHLFKKHNFKQIGIKKDWILSKGAYKDEILFQLIHEK